MPSKQKIVRRGSVWDAGLTGNRPLGLRGFSLAVNTLGGHFSLFFILGSSTQIRERV